MLINVDDGTYFMPKSSKSKAKAKTQLKTKRVTQPEASGITTNKFYWIVLSIFIVVALSVACGTLNFAIVDIVVLMIAIVFLIGLIGYVRISPSKLSKSKRGTFLFVGASIIGFSIWAIIMVILLKTETIDTVFGDKAFLIFPSLIICLTTGAFIGELMGKNSRVQKFFFKPKDDI